MTSKTSITREEALAFHKLDGKPGKVEIRATKPLMTQRDLSLAYSPGVAEPCVDIQKDPDCAYDYTSKGNMVAVISNGTAVLGLGNLGALASKPVMEGKAVLFKRFADVDSVDLEVETEDVDEFVNSVKFLGASWGGINLEDIKAPECFIIEDKLKECMSIPIFHDDQHGTAIITAAGVINAANIAGKKLPDMKFVVNGAGAAGIACIELLKEMGVKHNNVILCDTRGAIYKGRQDGMNQWKTKHAVETEARTLTDALKGADCFLGLSVKGAVTKEMVKGMGSTPIIFAMANPDPEITPDEAREACPDAIIATGRSDYNNQVNNVMGFPYIFRGALDVRATKITEEMKIAAANALAELAREDVPDEVSAAYQGRRMQYGPDYIIPTPFDPRLIETIPVAVAKAAEASGVAKKPIKDIENTSKNLEVELNPTANSLSLIYEKLRENPKTVVFNEGEEDTIIRAAGQWQERGYGKAILIGREDVIEKKAKNLNVKLSSNLVVSNSAINKKTDEYVEKMYKKMQREGYLQRDINRLVKTDRNVFGSAILENNDADIMITGLVKGYNPSLNEVLEIIDSEDNTQTPFGCSVLLAKKRTVFISDTSVNHSPDADELAEIAIETANFARRLGHEPKVALLSYSNFGNPINEDTIKIKEAVSILESLNLDFEFDGDISAEAALNEDSLKLYPFSRLTGPANVLIMPGLHSANISSSIFQTLGGGTVIGPVLCGLPKQAQVVNVNSSVREILNVTALAAI